ncbi:biopolymer transporter ExbD [Prevotella amnii]|jgi:hypothetical protein|uniref:Transport energizing protein, ExbD/TolR family n=1 Tax=Prevotella amnii TaxID=419005 RepID=A0A134BJ73_9BACT|nr:biopolymer transporter ExbD [Prevotella amnii]KXB79974.1 hypothetical protein HMPREF1860_00479 [Prevotella amnii]
MGIYRHNNHNIPELNTASLPDLIFSILFFFMLVTHMRKANIKVKYQEPAGRNLVRMEKKSTVDYIYIGKPVDEKGNIISKEDKIQLNDKLLSLSEIKSYLQQEYQSMSAEQRKKMTVNIKADKNINMGVIIDLKQMLRECNALNVFYSANTDKK